MNRRACISKLIKAHMLGLEAMKELLPDKALHIVNEIENECMDIVKEIAVGVLNENTEDTSMQGHVKKVDVSF